MRIIIVGLGNVGTTIARSLSHEGHDLTVIDISEAAVRNCTAGLDIMGLVGNGATTEMLKTAGIENTDLMIAVTNSDEKNLLACLVARKAGHCNTIARVRDPEYRKEINHIKDDLGLSFYVNPEHAAAGSIARLLKFPNAIEVDTFVKGRVELLKMKIEEGSVLDGIVLKNMRNTLHCDILVCMVERAEQTLIPDGNFVLKSGDLISFVASAKKANAFFKEVKVLQGRVKSAMIIGGGETTEYLAEQLITNGVDVKIIEKDMKRCEALAEILPEATIVNGDGTDKGLITEEGVERVESFIALTNQDETNVMMSFYVGKKNPKAKRIVKINKNAYEDIISEMDLGSIVNPKAITAEIVVKYVRAMQNSMGSNVETLYRIGDGKAEALEFYVREGSPLIGKPIMQLPIDNNVLIACIVHNNVIEIPTGHSVIAAKDTVIVVTTNAGYEDLKDILE